MNITELKCKLTFLGWTNTHPYRESSWQDEYSNKLHFTDSEIVLRLNNVKTKYTYMMDMQIIMDNILVATLEKDPGAFPDEYNGYP